MTWVQSSPSETQLYLVERDQRRTGRAWTPLLKQRSCSPLNRRPENCPSGQTQIPSHGRCARSKLVLY
jgi:hypothetical protein